MAVAVDDRDLWVLARTPEAGGPDSIIRYDADGNRRRARHLVPQGVRSIAIGDGAVWYTERRGRTSRAWTARRARRTLNVRMRESPYDVTYGMGFAWSTLREANTVERIDPKTARAISITGGHQPAAGARRRRAPSTSLPTATTRSSASTRASGQRMTPVSVGLNPFALAADDDGRIWVTGVGDGTLSRVTWR